MIGKKYKAVDKYGYTLATGWCRNEEAARRRFQRELSQLPISYSEWEESNFKIELDISDEK